MTDNLGLGHSASYRLGPKQCQRRGDAIVRISDDFRKNAVFLGFGTKPEDFTAHATAFFVFMDDGSSSEGAYLVTAGHVAQELRDIPFDIRINKSDDTSKVEHIDKMEWRFHDSFPEVDVAIAHYVPPNGVDVSAISVNDFADKRHFVQHAAPDIISEDIFWDIGAGDAVYVIGLFNLLQGKKRNAQFVYNGRIALLPGDEKIPVSDNKGNTLLCEGYLIEIHTLPGASGSPVIVRGTVAFKAQQAETEDEFIAYAHTRAFLLGLYQGSWEGPPEALFARARATTATRVAMGVGIVVPAIRIKEVLMYDDVVAARRERIEARRAKGAAVQDSAFPVRPAAEGEVGPVENESHREDFTRLVSAASKKQKPAR